MDSTFFANCLPALNEASATTVFWVVVFNTNGTRLVSLTIITEPCTSWRTPPSQSPGTLGLPLPKVGLHTFSSLPLSSKIARSLKAWSTTTSILAATRSNDMTHLSSSMTRSMADTSSTTEPSIALVERPVSEAFFLQSAFRWPYL